MPFGGDRLRDASGPLTVAPMRTVLIAAQSLDGFITRHDEPGVAWASIADQTWFRHCLTEFDSQVMGRVTFDTIRPHVSLGHAEAPHRVVLTRRPRDFAHEQREGRLVFTADSPERIVADLRAAGRRQCAVLGGAHVHDLFLAAGQVDELWITVEPRIFGRGTPLVGEKHDLQLRLLDSQRLPDSDSVVLRYSVKR